MTPRELVAQQALDEGLWFVAQTVTEAYLQAALRALHEVVESDTHTISSRITHFADDATLAYIAELERRIAELRELMAETGAALDTIYRHASQQPSALSTAIADTCEEMAEKYRAWEEKRE